MTIEKQDAVLLRPRFPARPRPALHAPKSGPTSAWVGYFVVDDPLCGGQRVYTSRWPLPYERWLVRVVLGWRFVARQEWERD